MILKLIGLDCEIVDNLDKIGGQCIELYPDKPIYDIPAVSECTGEELTKNLIDQLKPFNIKFHLSERVDEVKNNNGNWEVKTNKGTKFSTPNIIIAGGVGSFEPRKFFSKECEKFENESILYSIKDKTIFKGKTVSIFGGGDSALDWTIELANIASNVTLIHRRNEFRGALDSVEKVQELKNKNKIKLITPAEVVSLMGDDKLKSVEIKIENSENITLNVDCFIPLFGLTPKLGPIHDWGLEIEKKSIKVDNTLNYQTNVPGIFAIGDINTYPGKLKLILCGFHEAAMMCRSAYKIINPDKKLVLKYTTVSGVSGFDGSIKKAQPLVRKSID